MTHLLSRYFSLSRVVLPILLAVPLAAVAATPVCEARSGDALTPVIELYTSEGCSACPPADKWLSSLKGQPVVAQAFHVGYWDYIGWVDRFATPANTSRQRDIARINRLGGIYTPQLVRNGRDWRAWRANGQVLDGGGSARASIVLRRIVNTDNFEAEIMPASDVQRWSAYWTVTEHGHSSRVKAGENAGEFLQHDFVVRQYTPVGTYQGKQTLHFAAIAATLGMTHARQINLVVSDPLTGAPFQAVSLSRC